MSNEAFVPCKECINSALSSVEMEPLYYCKAMKELILYPKLKHMYSHCPL